MVKLSDPNIGPYQILPLRAREDLEAMAMMGYSTIPKAPTLLATNHLIVLCNIQDARCGGLKPLQWHSRCILQPQMNRLEIKFLYSYQ